MTSDELTDDRVRHLGVLVAQDGPLLGLVVDGHYEVKRRIGRGGMGEVFLAQDRRLNRPVAMKVVASEALDAETTARFRSEAQTLAQLEHPGIVPIHDLGSLPDGRMYFTMKFVEGRTMEEMLRARTERDRLVEVLASACEILHRAHERDVVHRDLKPSNIMVDGGGQVYVMDWGIARTQATSGLTVSGVVMGTLAYMAPEQARGDKRSVDRRSDVYSIGAILYEILTGLPPVVGETLEQALRAARGGAPGRIAQDAPEYLKSACLKALAADPSARHATAQAMAAALRGAGRSRRGWWALVPAFLLLAALAWWKWPRSAPPSPRMEPVATPTPKPDGVETPLERGDRFLKAQEWKLAEDAYTEAIRLSPATARGYAGRGEARYHAKNLKGALEDYETAVSLDAGNVEYRFDRGLVREKIGDPNGALKDFDEVLRADPNHARAYNARGNLREDSAKAIADYTEAIARDRSFPSPYFNRAVLRRERKDLVGALEDLDEFLKLKPDDPRGLYERGWVYLLLQRWEEALKDSREAIDRLPVEAEEVGWAKMHVWEAESRLKKLRAIADRARGGDRLGAIGDYADYLRSFPTDFGAQYACAVLRAADEDWRGARDDLERSLSHAPKNWPDRSAAEKLLEEVRRKLAK